MNVRSTIMLLVAVVMSVNATSLPSPCALVRCAEGTTCMAAGDTVACVPVVAPCICTREYKPVCGYAQNDDDHFIRKTFGNKCEANCAGAIKVTGGECKDTHVTMPPAPTPAPTKPAACICTKEYKPVCGYAQNDDDHFIRKTFGNKCEANCAGAIKVTGGECKEMPPTRQTTTKVPKTSPFAPTPGGKCKLGSRPFVQTSEHCGEKVVTMRCDCETQYSADGSEARRPAAFFGMWACLAIDHAPCDKTSSTTLPPTEVTYPTKEPATAVTLPTQPPTDRAVSFEASSAEENNDSSSALSAGSVAGLVGVLAVVLAAVVIVVARKHTVHDDASITSTSKGTDLGFQGPSAYMEPVANEQLYGSVYAIEEGLYDDATANVTSLPAHDYVEPNIVCGTVAGGAAGPIYSLTAVDEESFVAPDVTYDTATADDMQQGVAWFEEPEYTLAASSPNDPEGFRAKSVHRTNPLNADSAQSRY